MLFEKVSAGGTLSLNRWYNFFTAFMGDYVVLKVRCEISE